MAPDCCRALLMRRCKLDDHQSRLQAAAGEGSRDANLAILALGLLLRSAIVYVHVQH